MVEGRQKDRAASVPSSRTGKPAKRHQHRAKRLEPPDPPKAVLAEGPTLDSVQSIASPNQSGRGQPHSKTFGASRRKAQRASVLECGCPLPLWISPCGHRATCSSSATGGRNETWPTCPGASWPCPRSAPVLGRSIRRPAKRAVLFRNEPACGCCCARGRAHFGPGACAFWRQC
jgi:hypothetical protein